MRALILVVAMIYATGAYAADPKTIFGSWIEKFANGNGMVTEFSPQTIWSYSVDAAGKTVKDVGKFTVTYRNLDPSTIGIDFQGGTGGVMVLVKDRDTIVLDFPGVGAHTLKRMGPPQ